MPRVSIVIPAHNAEGFLPDTLESVRRQSFGDWEIVAVDDGSTDGTWNVLESSDLPLRALRNDTPRGPAGARNRALAAAEGELVVFLDADDLLLTDYLAEQVACLDRARSAGRRVGIVTCDAQLLDGERLAAHTYLDQIPDRDAPVTLERVLRRNPIYIGSLVVRSAGEEVGWFDEELFGTEDFGLWLKILEQGYDAVLNPRVLAVYRRHTGSVSSNIARQGLNNRRAYELALARGRLSPGQRRIARAAIRYNRAMELVARVRFDGLSVVGISEIVRGVPLLVRVAVSNPRWWRQWLSVLAGRGLPVPRSRR